MIGKTVIGRTFRGCVNYNISKVEKGMGEILECRGVRDYSKRGMIHDFKLRAQSNPNLSRCVWHTALSFQEDLSNNQMLMIVKDWITRMGLAATQYVIVRHTDTVHPHAHIVANRIDDDGTTISDSNNWKRSETICRELEVKHGLKIIPTQRDEKKINREKLKGKDLLKTDINRLLTEHLNKISEMRELVRLMSTKGITCSVKNNSDGTLRGITFEKENIRIKASDVHKSFSVKNLLSKIELNKANLAREEKMNRNDFSIGF
jgi:Relaxase/Mobilisation nuclease domain